MEFGPDVMLIERVENGWIVRYGENHYVFTSHFDATTNIAAWLRREEEPS